MARLRNDADKEAKTADTTTTGENRRKKVNFYFINQIGISENHTFQSVEDLIAAIGEFLAVWNQKPKPFVWTATVDSILAKLARCRQNLEKIQPGCTLSKGRKRLSS